MLKARQAGKQNLQQQHNRAKAQTATRYAKPQRAAAAVVVGPPSLSITSITINCTSYSLQQQRKERLLPPLKVFSQHQFNRTQQLPTNSTKWAA